MPFRCKCGRSFEKPDSFSTHTSACAPFQHRRASDSAAMQSSYPPYATSLPNSALSFDGSSSFDAAMANSPNHDPPPQNLSASSPFWMPTGISIQNVFEGARRRSMSNATFSYKR